MPGGVFRFDCRGDWTGQVCRACPLALLAYASPIFAAQVKQERENTPPLGVGPWKGLVCINISPTPYPSIMCCTEA